MPTNNPLVNWLVGLVIALVIALWVRLERQGNQRHADNTHWLESIDGKVDKLDGRAERHEAILEIHGREIEALRSRMKT